MTSAPLRRVNAWLRAAGEPTRLRLLALCVAVPATVSELARTLKQSEPRVSRHLRILCEAGLVERVRQGQWVSYRISADAAAASFARGLIAQLDPRDPHLARDRAAARSLAAASLAAPSRLGKALAGFFTPEGGSLPLGRLLLVGGRHPELLESAAGLALQLTALAPSRMTVQGLRACSAARGVECRVLSARRAAAPTAADLARAGTRFDAVLFDLPMTDAALGALLAAAGRLLVPGGRVWVFEPYDVLESASERVVEHPLARLRRLIGAAGLTCERLGPIEADGEHVLAAVARASSALGPDSAVAVRR